MQSLLYGVMGRASLGFELLRRVRGDHWHRGASDADAGLDRTGRVVEESTPVGLWAQTTDIIFPRYDSLGQSFWRAQELTLLSRYRHLLETPIADFGCGDGSFTSMVLDKADYGIDIDAQALALAKERQHYASLVQTDGLSIPLPDCSVGSLFSNSVLEHVVHLKETVAELFRILKPGGIALITVPVRQFERDLATYFGTRESRQINWDFYHRNLLEPEDWKTIFAEAGFTIRMVRPYQPDWFTFWFRMFRLAGKRGFARFIPSIQERIWRRYGTGLLSMVRRSVEDTERGGNIFVILEKPGRNESGHWVDR